MFYTTRNSKKCFSFFRMEIDVSVEIAYHQVFRQVGVTVYALGEVAEIVVAQLISQCSISLHKYTE